MEVRLCNLLRCLIEIHLNRFIKIHKCRLTIISGINNRMSPRKRKNIQGKDRLQMGVLT